MRTYIVGYGGFAKEVFDQFINQEDNFNFGGFIILENDKAFVVYEDVKKEFSYDPQSSFIIGTGVKKWKQIFINHLLKTYLPIAHHFPNAISSRAYISKAAKLGIGNTFAPFSVVNADAKIGNFNTFNIFSSVNHDCEVGNRNIISPYAGIMGSCKVGDDNFLGTNCSLTPTVEIQNDNTISAGECVFDNMDSREFFQSGIVTKKK